MNYGVYAILLEIILWIYMFLRFSRNMSYYRAVLFSDFIITTIDFVLAATPFRTTLLYIILYNRVSGEPLLRIPVTFGIFLLVKTGLFYSFQELLPLWFFKQPKLETPTLERGEDEHDTVGST